MKKSVVTLVAAVALTTMGMAAASTNGMAASNQTFPNGNSAGIFIGGNVGYGEFDVSKDAGATSFSNTGFAWNGNLGYQFDRYFAVESGYTHFAKATESDNFGNSAKINDIYGIDLLAKGILPINSQFNVFAKAGAMYLSAKPSVAIGNYSFVGDSTSRYVPEFGLGTAYYVTSNVAVSLQGITTLKSNNNMPATYAAYAGLSYKFNV